MLKQVAALVHEAAPGSPVRVRMADEWVAELSKLTARDGDYLGVPQDRIDEIEPVTIVGGRIVFDARAFEQEIRRPGD